MKIRHIKGTKVCAVEDKLNECVMAYNYKDVVTALNKIFREAEVLESSGPDSDPMKVILLMLAGSYKIDVKKYNPQDIVYDDEKTSSNAKGPTMKLPRFTDERGMYRGLKIIPGGKPADIN